MPQRKPLTLVEGRVQELGPTDSLAVNTLPSNDSSTNAASTAFVQAALAAVGPGGGIETVPYADRDQLRTKTGSCILVDMLGLFEFDADSTLVDDDESVFATADGRWVLRCPSFDLIEAWNLPRNSMLGRVISGWINCSVATVAANSYVTITAKVPGVEPGDNILVTAPAPLGTTAAATSALSFYAYCAEVGTVFLVLANVTATPAPLQVRVQTNWPVTVVKAN